MAEHQTNEKKKDELVSQARFVQNLAAFLFFTNLTDCLHPSVSVSDIW